MRYDHIDDADQLEAAKKVLKVRADKGKTADVLPFVALKTAG
jgi:hypothetical protein